MYKCPIDYYTGNLIFNADKSCWGVFKLTGFDYDFRDDNEKMNILFQTARFLAGTGTETTLLIVPVQQDIEAHYAKLKENLHRDDELYEAALNYTEQVEKYLKEKAYGSDNNDYRSYVIARLETVSQGDIASSMQNLFQFMVQPVNGIHGYMGLDKKDILGSRVEQLKKAAEKWYFSQNQKLSMTEVSGEELQWVFRRMAFRGLKEDVRLFYKDTRKNVWEPRAKMEKQGRENVIKPLKRDIVNLFSGCITTKDRVVRVEHDKNTSYQTFLAVTGLPDSWEFPGNEWIYRMQQSDVRPEICIHIKSTEFRESTRKIERKKREIDSQAENAQKGNADIPEDLIEGKDYAEILEQEIKTNKDPLLNVSIALCLAAENEKILEEKATTIREEYEDMNFIVERPVSDQIKLYMSFIPGVGNMVRDYVMPLTPTTLASGVIGANRGLGDDKGGYIGITGNEGKNVYLSMGRACLLNKSASATFFGNLGFGKSFNANLLVFLEVLMGGFALIFDPKGERSHWEKEFSVLKGQIATVTLAATKENTGLLDPYNIYAEDIDEANELAINVLTEMFKISPNSLEYTALLEAAQRLAEEAEEKRPSMIRLAEALESFSKNDDLYATGKLIARRIRLQRSAGLARLLIGEGGEKTIALSGRMNILQIQNLKLPSPETPKADYTAEENVSTVVMMVLSHFAKKFALVPRNVFSVILFDESWALGKTAEGVKMYDFLSRMGRSLYTGCIFNGHSVLDIPTEGIKNTITYKFCFCTTNEAEAIRMCEYLGLEATEENKKTIMNLRNGECMFQDLDKRVGILQFDAVFQDIIDVFSTTPKAKENDVEMKAPAETETEEMTEEQPSDMEALEREAAGDAASLPDDFPEIDIDLAKVMEEEIIEGEPTPEELENALKAPPVKLEGKAGEKFEEDKKPAVEALAEGQKAEDLTLDTEEEKAEAANKREEPEEEPPITETLAEEGMSENEETDEDTDTIDMSDILNHLFEREII